MKISPLNNYIYTCSPLLKNKVKHLKIILFFVIILNLYFILRIFSTFKAYRYFKDIPPKPDFKCLSNSEHIKINNHSTKAQINLDARVLLLVESLHSSLGKNISELLVSNHIKYKSETSLKALHHLAQLDRGKYAAIIFENFERYLTLNKWTKGILDKYCKIFEVGIIGFLPSRDDSILGIKFQNFPLKLHNSFLVKVCLDIFINFCLSQNFKNAYLNAKSPVLRLTRSGGIVQGVLPGKSWTYFTYDQNFFDPIEFVYPAYDNLENENRSEKLITVVQDKGLYDGIPKVLFGSGLQLWLHHLILLDSLSFLSHGKLSVSLERFILIDIDDIFVGPAGFRMTSEDVQALLEMQSYLTMFIKGFRFNLGFSGKFFHHGTPEENKGEDLLLSKFFTVFLNKLFEFSENSHRFWWFCHTWNHTQPHLIKNLTVLEENLKLNMNFAKNHGLDIESGYSISPHHSGVYPVHEILYKAWRNVLNIKVTATEEYPHLRPARLRKGFIHSGIMVLPRQTCDLYTHTVFLNNFPGGKNRLDAILMGGEVFQTIVNNQIVIFMTHLSNYGNDRLALYAFELVFQFLTCWTNLNFITINPVSLGQKYFQIFENEKDPIWGNPCHDRRHQNIWSSDENCNQFPSLLVLGPQKTGTTALYTFLNMHPNIVSNQLDINSYEELQFFSNAKKYSQGIQCKTVVFEKSATYFDGENVPTRVSALLPKVQLIVIIISPSKRAYSWYQHQRAHGDHTALQYNFIDVLTLVNKEDRRLRELRNRCLNPGMYARHLEKWLLLFPPQQLFIMDGEQLKTNPSQSMNEVQKFLQLPIFLNYSNHLIYDSAKGFYCQIVNHKSQNVKCLGRSKGRKYDSMDNASQKFLKSYYRQQNIALEKLLNRLGYPIPEWLRDDIIDLQ